jgi:hypothetical protein
MNSYEFDILYNGEIFDKQNLNDIREFLKNLSVSDSCVIKKTEI